MRRSKKCYKDIKKLYKGQGKVIKLYNDYI